VQNLCRNTCYGCDDVLNSCSQPDRCGVCLGDNSTCVDCAGVFNGNAVEDACDVCSGTNRTCVVPTFGLTMNGLNCLDTVERNLTHLFQGQWGNAVWTLTAPLPTKGTATLTAVVTGPTTIYLLEYTTYQYAIGADAIHLHAVIPSTGATGDFIITVNIATCVDCFGVINGPAVRDLCGVCDGLNNTCDGCDGVPASGKVDDICGVCDGDGRSCVNITTTPPSVVNCTRQIIFQLDTEPATTPVTWSVETDSNSGTVFVNPTTGVVEWVNTDAFTDIVWFVIRATSNYNSSVYDDLNVTFDVLNCTDCNGHQNGFQLIDVCGICGGDGKSCQDCFGIPGGNATLDICRVCDGDGSTCNGPINGTLFLLVIIVTVVASILLFMCALQAMCGRPGWVGPPPEVRPTRVSGNTITTFGAVETDPLLADTTPTMAVLNPHEQAVINYGGKMVMPLPASGSVDFFSGSR